MKSPTDGEFDVDYYLNETTLAESWANKIKHLKNIPVDPIESNKTDLNDLVQIYREFCKFSGEEEKKITNIDQETLNRLHGTYERTHESLSRKENNSILYKFHHSIHYHEDKQTTRKRLDVGWGTYEGPLTQNFPCNNFYEKQIVKNNIYLPWAELGKKPFVYWKNKEPSNKDRFMELCKPHQTFRAKFMIALQDIIPTPLPNQFTQWFEQYKDSWLYKNKLQKWDEIDETSAPLLAVANHKVNLSDKEFVKIL